jgi:amidase
MVLIMEEATLAQLQAALEAGQHTSRQLVEFYLERIAMLDRQGPQLRSVIEINPDALEIADQLDQERVQQGARGPLHGIPILLKESIATTDQMQTTAGSLALLGARPAKEAFVVQRLRAAGAVILGKANLSEWANFRSTHSSSGWSSRGGQCRNPYILDRTPCGSSSGSAVAVAANLIAVAVGTETDGSILSPASMNGVVGIKPTVGLVSRAGVVPISHSQDTVGPFGRTVADAALVLNVLAGQDPDDLATLHDQPQHDYTQFLDPDGLRGARIGIPREVYCGYSVHADRIINVAIEQMRALGAEIIDPADIPTAKQMETSEAEITVLHYEFKADLNRYLAALASSPVRTLAEIIAFNQVHAEEMLPYFGQELLIEAEATSTLEDPTYRVALETTRRLSRQEGIDTVMERYHLDALVMPSTVPAWCIDLVNGDPAMGSSSQPAALAGYPAISVPAGEARGLPIGITFIGRAFGEPTLVKLAYAYEYHTHARRPPQFLPTLSIEGRQGKGEEKR